MTSAVTGVDYNNLGLGLPQTKAADTSLGQDQFLKLMLTQLKNQDPTKPLDSNDFLGQMAQFSTVSGLAGLQTSFDSLASSLVSNQALQAAGLVGRSALVEGSTITLGAGQGVSGALDLPASSGDVRIHIKDANGQTVRDIDLGSQEAGLVAFTWDGTTDGHTPADAGRYNVTADFRGDSGTEAGTTFLTAPIDSVLFGKDGFQVLVRGIGQMPFASVREIRDNSNPVGGP